jgi:1-acyl-sn-glycerol-3-phosphate acyltransferase
MCDEYKLIAFKKSTHLKYTYSRPQIMHILYEALIAIIALSYLAFFGVFLSLISLILQLFWKALWFQRVGRRVLHFLLHLFFAGLKMSRLLVVDFSALDKLKHEPGMLIIANHPCLMDALFFSSRLPNLVSVMKSDVLKNPMFFGGAKLSGFIPSGSPRDFIRKCCEILANDAHLLLFPEGTRSVSRHVNAFKKGFALVAREANVPVQTVFIEANTPFLGKGWSLLSRPIFPLNYRATLGKRFQFSEGENYKQFASKLEQYFKTHIPDYQQPPRFDEP